MNNEIKYKIVCKERIFNFTLSGEVKNETELLVLDLIQKTIATMLLQEVNDERFRFVTITGVTVSKDFSYSKIYFTLHSSVYLENMV